MTVLHTAKERKNISIKYYGERINGFTQMKNIISGETKTLEDFSLEPMESGVWELLK